MTVLATIHNAGQVTRLRDGRRLVTATVGRKRVRLEDCSGRVAWVTRQVYAEILVEQRQHETGATR